MLEDDGSALCSEWHNGRSWNAACRDVKIVVVKITYSLVPEKVLKTEVLWLAIGWRAYSLA